MANEKTCPSSSSDNDYGYDLAIDPESEYESSKKIHLICPFCQKRIMKENSGKVQCRCGKIFVLDRSYSKMAGDLIHSSEEHNLYCDQASNFELVGINSIILRCVFCNFTKKI